MGDVLQSVVWGLFRRFFSRPPIEADFMALRHQVAVLQRQIRHRPKLTPWDRLLFAALYRVQPSVLRSISIVQPETVVRWLSLPKIPSGWGPALQCPKCRQFCPADER